MFDKINNIASKKLIYLFKCHSIILLVRSNQPVPTAHKCYHPHPLNNTLVRSIKHFDQCWYQLYYSGLKKVTKSQSVDERARFIY